MLFNKRIGKAESTEKIYILLTRDWWK